MATYLKNKDLLAEIIKSKELGKLTNTAVEMLWKLAKESNKKLNYKNPQDREDCISAAMLDLLKYWNRFDPKITTNAFAFYTQVAKNGFAKGWNELNEVKHSQKISISNGQDSGMYNI